MCGGQSVAFIIYFDFTKCERSEIWKNPKRIVFSHIHVFEMKVKGAQNHCDHQWSQAQHCWRALLTSMHCVFLGSLTTKEGTRIQRPRSHFRPLSTVSAIKCFRVVVFSFFNGYQTLPKHDLPISLSIFYIGSCLLRQHINFHRTADMEQCYFSINYVLL